MSTCHRMMSAAWIGIALVAMNAGAADVTTGLTLWLDASDATTVLHDANQVTNWVDKANAANSVFQANPGNCPTYVPAGGPVASGILRFDGGQFLANSVDVNTYITGGEHTEVAVFRPSTFGTVTPPYAYAATAIMGEPGGYWGLALSGSGASGFVRTYAQRQYGYAETASWLGTNQFSGYWSAAGNGAVVGHVFGSITNTRPNIADASIHSAAGAMTIGHSTYGQFLIGDVAELRVYDRLLTPSELAELEAYLTSKWNLPTPSAPPARPPVGGATLSLDAMDTRSFFLLSDGYVPGWVSEVDLSMIFLGANAPSNVISAAPTGLNVARFDGVNDRLEPAVSTTLNGIITSTNYTVMTVFRAASVDTVATYSWDCEGLFGELGGYWGLYFNGPNTSPTLRAYHYSTGDQYVSLPIETNRFYVATWSLTDGTMTLGLYGGASGSLAVGPLYSYAFETELAIGKIYTTGSFFDGDLCELVVYDHALSAGEQAAMQQYLYEKWISGGPPKGTIIVIR